LILCDNTSKHLQQSNVAFQDKTYSYQFHFLEERVTKKNIKLEYIGTKEHIVDIFTKPLPRDNFEYLQQILGVISSPI
jgi:hypothetical protein